MLFIDNKDYVFCRYIHVPVVSLDTCIGMHHTQDSFTLLGTTQSASIIFSVVFLPLLTLGI